MTSVVTVNASAAGLQVTSQEIVDSEVGAVINATLAVGKVGALTTRSDANTGTLTMNSGHGITTGDRLDIFWLDATTGLPKCQYKVTAGTVSTDSVPIDSGVGDNLPTLVAGTYAIVAFVALEYDISFLTANLEVFFAGGNATGKIVMEDSGGTVVYHKTLGPTGQGFAWTLASGAANPVSDDVAVAYLSNGSSVSTNTISGFAGLVP